jgi:cystathionine gamma-synthase
VFDLLPAGSRAVIPDDCYQGVSGLAEAGQRQGRWSVERLVGTATENWVRACQTADLVWLESPSNPLLIVADVQRICAAPRKSGSLLAVDNTFATPLNQRPLDLGADISVQSATKFIGGHSDLLAGVATVVSSTLRDALRKRRELAGATPGVLEAFLAVRGARTMAIRLQRAQETAVALTAWLKSHPLVSTTRYPGFGSIISFDVRGNHQTADAVCRHVQVITHATSLGAVESTIERRAAIPGQHHLPESLLRLSVGIEHADDLRSDLDQALQRSAKT